jgi:hypothetical protein
MRVQMRFIGLIITIMLGAMSAAHAAVLWSETTNRGYPLTHWTKGATLEEVLSAAKSYSGVGELNILAQCRGTGWFAYVGAQDQFQRGVSCGYENKESALHKARMECLAEGGKCTLERVGYDDGRASPAASAVNGVPTSLPGLLADGAPLANVMGPLEGQGTIFSTLLPFIP